MMRHWGDLSFWNSKEWDGIQERLSQTENAGLVYYPEYENIFEAFKLTPFKKVKAVILGQDPYHNGDATGLAFSSMRKATNVPESLKNIFKEYKDDLGFPQPATGNLAPWAKNGVLLLNTALTVLKGQANSHQDIGWAALINEVLFEVSKTHPTAVFILWGQEAQQIAVPQISGSPRVASPHPSPLSAHRGFFGSRPFTRANALRIRERAQPIDWRLP